MSMAVPLWILVFLATSFFLREARTLFVPVALAVLASYALRPVMVWCDRIRLPRVVSAAIVVSLIFAMVGWVGWALSDDAARAVRDLPQQVREIRTDLRDATSGGFLDNLNAAATELQRGSGSSTAGASGGATAVGSGELGNYLWQGSTSLFGLLGHVVVVAFLTYFLLVGDEPWHNRLVRLSGIVLSSRKTGADVLDEINTQIQRFLLMRVVTSVIVGAATGVALVAFDAPAPGLWAVAAGVFNWVPYFGPVIVSGGLLIVGFVAGGIGMALELSLTALAITSLEGWLLTPMLLGRAAKVNTIAVFLSLLFWSWVWGIWGTILAVPMTSVVKAVADHLDPLEWLSHLLSEDHAGKTSRA